FLRRTVSVESATPYPLSGAHHVRQTTAVQRIGSGGSPGSAGIGCRRFSTPPPLPEASCALACARCAGPSGGLCYGRRPSTKVDARRVADQNGFSCAPPAVPLERPKNGGHSPTTFDSGGAGQ